MSLWALASSRKRIRHLQEELAKANHHRETLVGHLAHYDELREQMLDDRVAKMAKDAIAAGAFTPPANA